MTTITVTFDPPLPSDSPATFNSKAFDTLGDLNTWSGQANTVAGEVNTNATNAATSAGTASTHASTATTQAGIATTQAGIATTQAGLATTNGAAQVALAAAQVSLATTQANTATTQAGTATTQAGIATTKASEADASAIAAAASAASIAPGSLLTAANPSYTGTLTGGTGIVNLGSGQFVKDAAGNVGVGVTPSAWAAGHRVAEFGTVANSVGALSDGDFNLANNAFLGGSGWVYKISAGATRFQQDFGVSRWLIDSGTKTAGAACNFTTAVTLDASGNLTSNAGALGYGAGAGGTVTQVTSKATAVTLNKPSGTITMHNAALGVGAQVEFVLNNSFIAVGDKVFLQTTDSSLGFKYRVGCYFSGSGSCHLWVANATGVSLSDYLTLSFAVIKGSTT